ncbi:MAG TPA: hypothetical protein DDY88_05850 [Actinobacteria bacterium]|nr:hypothetical protein [Actinomycetota bacterium]
MACNIPGSCNSWVVPVPRLTIPKGGPGLVCTLAVASLLVVGCASGQEPTTEVSSSPSNTASTPLAPQSASASDALHQAIAGIDAAVYAYGVVGAHVNGTGQRQSLRAITTLNRQRAAFELALGTTINEAAVTYVLPGPVTDAQQARQLAELLEMKLIPLFDQVASATVGAARSVAKTASLKAAQRAQHWTPTPPA